MQNNECTICFSNKNRKLVAYIINGTTTDMISDPFEKYSDIPFEEDKFKQFINDVSEKYGNVTFIKISANCIGLHIHDTIPTIDTLTLLIIEEGNYIHDIQPQPKLETMIIHDQDLPLFIHKMPELRILRCFNEIDMRDDYISHKLLLLDQPDYEQNIGYVPLLIPLSEKQRKMVIKGRGEYLLKNVYPVCNKLMNNDFKGDLFRMIAELF